jgi:antitoxin CcdA
MLNLAKTFLPKPDGNGDKKSTNLTLSAALVTEANQLGINLSKAAARGLAEEIAERRAEQWLAENQDAMSEWNEHIERNGVPLARFRQF